MREYQSTVRTEKQSEGERKNDTESEIVTKDGGGRRRAEERGRK